MKTEIKTANERFIFRLEDVFYSLIALFAGLLGFFVLNIFINHLPEDILTGVMVSSLVFFMGVCASIGIIWNSYRERKHDRYFIEEEAIVKYVRNQRVFRIPFNSIVSVRINNKRGKQGTIILFTDKKSLDYSFMYLPFFMSIPMALYGLTDKKINLATDRKFLVTEIYKRNPKLNIIENL